MGIIETLQAEIQSLKERVTALEQRAKGSDDKIFRTTPERKEAARARVQAQRQKTRDDIIEMAKRDVAELRMSARQNLLRARFVVNREKRTVVCLLERFDLGYIKSRGIAKCHPDDCFNAHIGRAIALRRALGLEVPEAYLNAPQPTEVRVGDVVKSKINENPKYKICGVCGDYVDVIEVSFEIPYLNRPKNIFYVVDDSREDAEQEVWR